MKRQAYLAKHSQPGYLHKNTGSQKPVSSPGKKPHKRRRFNLGDFIALILLLSIGIWGGLQVKDYVCFKILDFAQPVQGVLEHTAPAQAVVIRHEALLKAPLAGTFQPVALERQRVIANATLGYMVQEGGHREAVKAPGSGLVLYHTDGYEELLQNESLEDLDLDLLFANLPPKQESAPAAMVYGKGQAVGKIVDNLLDFTVILRLNKQFSAPEEGRIAFFSRQSTAALQGKLLETLESGAYLYLLLNVSSKEEILITKRYFEAEILLNSFQGYIIPETALIQDEEGREGVLARGSRRLVFKPVEVAGLANGQAAVHGLGEWDEIILNPQQAYAGQKLF